MRDTEAIHLKLVATVWLQQQWPRPRLIAADCSRQAALYRAGIATIRRIESQEGPMMGYVSTLWRLRPRHDHGNPACSKFRPTI
jgi:hypothetical protein